MSASAGIECSLTMPSALNIGSATPTKHRGMIHAANFTSEEMVKKEA